MKVLVTGSTGFVGSCLTRRLLEIGHEVHVLTRQASDQWRIKDVLPELRPHEADLRDPFSLEKAVKEARPEVIFHLATFGGFAFQTDSGAIIDSNFLGTVNLLRACEKVGFDYFVNTGSSSEYGIKLIPMAEEDFLEPTGDYSVSKASATLFCTSEARQKGLPIVTLRLFSPYGPWDDGRRLIPHVINAYLNSNSPKLSTPLSVRDYIYIDDVIDLYLRFLDKPLLSQKVFNLGSGVQHSIGDVVSILTESIGDGRSPEWGSLQSQRPEPQIWVANMSRTKEILNWAPEITLRDGLEKTIHWFRENLHLYQ